MASFDVSVEVTFNFDAAKARQGIAIELYQFAEEVMAVSKEVVPVDMGNLMNTGHVELPVDSGNEISVTMGYGGPAVNYALVVHENLDPRVNWHRPGSGPKFLENPLKERQDKLPERIANGFRAGME